MPNLDHVTVVAHRRCWMVNRKIEVAELSQHTIDARSGLGAKMAVLTGLPHEVYGFWAEQGATVIRADEFDVAIMWLEQHGHRKPYKAEAGINSDSQK